MTKRFTKAEGKNPMQTKGKKLKRGKTARNKGGTVSMGKKTKKGTTSNKARQKIGRNDRGSRLSTNIYEVSSMVDEGQEDMYGKERRIPSPYAAGAKSFEEELHPEDLRSMSVEDKEG